MIQRAVFLWALSLVLMACPSNVKRCETASDCSYPGSVCQEGLCVLGEGARDAGPTSCTSNPSCGGGANVCGSNGVCVVDVTPPSVSFLTPMAGALVSTDTVTVTGTASDAESGLASLELSTDGVSFTSVSLTGGQFSTALPVPAVQAASLVMTARATDVGGLVSTATLTLTADRVGPSLTIATPAADGNCTATACSGALVTVASASSVAIAGSAVDPSGVASASLRILDGAAVLVPATSLTVGSDGSWTFSWSSVPNVNGRAYVVEVTASDSAGNAASPVTRTIIVDRVAPTATFSSPVAGSLIGASSVTLAGVASDGASFGVGSAETSLDGATWSATPLAADGSFSASLAVPSVDHVAQTLSLRVTDLAGNQKIFTVSYVADRVAPVVAVTSPSLDDSCPSTTAACMGAVANAAASSYAFSGTVAEGGGVNTVTLTTDVYDPATNSVLQASTPAAASPWSATWTSLPTGVNGHEYQLRVSATDAAGNKGTVIRRVWLDNVLPTATALVSNARLVARTANLLSFSEPMVPSTTLAAMSFTPAVTATTLGPNGAGTTYSFTGTDLAYYTGYTLSVGTGATDRAGNPLAAAVSEKFLTLTAPLTLPLQLLVSNAACTPAMPRVAVDADGRPAVATACGGTLRPYLVRVSGGGVVNAPDAIAADTGGVTWSMGDLRVLPSNDTLKTDLTRLLGYRLAIPYTTLSGGQLEYVERSDTGAWLKADGTSGFDSFFPSSATGVPFFDIDPPHRTVVWVPELLRIGGMTSPGALASRVFSGTWATNSLASPTGFVEQNGAVDLTYNGSVYTLTYFDHQGSSTVASILGSSFHAAGEVPLISFALTGIPSTLTPAFVAWGAKSGGGALASSGVTVACSRAPTSATPGWLSTTTVFVYGPNAQPALKVATALNELKFAAAVDLGGSVQVVSVPGSSPCTAVPVVTVVGSIPNAKDPGVAVDASGVIWVAYASTATGNLMLTHF